MCNTSIQLRAPSADLPSAGAVRGLSDKGVGRLVVWLLLALVMLFSALARADDTLLDPAVAFKFAASEKPGEIELHYTIANGYYMYRERFAFAVKKGQATLGAAVLPQGKVKFDDTFQKNVETYRNDLIVRIPVAQAAGPFDFSVTSQGCADLGVCYPPIEHVVHVSGAALQAAGTGPAAAASPAADEADVAGSGLDRLYSQEYVQSVLQGHSVLSALAIFFVLGLALSLLPCSLPMIPILSSIILGEGTKLTRGRGFMLSLAYVLGMAVVYTAFGVIAALAGQSLGVWLQNPWVLSVFALLLVGFALSLFGYYELQLPQAWQNRVGGISQRRAGGKGAAVFAMGAVSALVVGACMTAPLFGVLAFIAQTGDLVFGGAALFVMALGIGVPLLVVGVGAGALLPRGGVWMEGVKRLFGMLLLAVALWMVAPVLPAWLAMLLWALWLLIGAAGLGLREFAPAGASSAAMAGHVLCKGLAALLALCAAALIVGVAAGSRDLLQPLAVFAGRAGAGAAGGPSADEAALFARVKSSAELDRALQSGARPAMFDFYADWCVSCKEMEKFTFSDPRVQARLAQLNLLQADVTANNADDQALLKRFRLYGPPGIIFFDAQGKELLRVVGYQPADTFLRSLDRAFGASGQGAPKAMSSATT
jgi:thiol:disulfide interchange protein DsbD